LNHAPVVNSHFQFFLIFVKHIINVSFSCFE